MATLDEETAASCIYSRPVGKENGKQKFAEGMSIRMAEIVGASYGNLRVGAMLIEQTDRYVKARGFAHDLESNFASTSEVIESTVKRDGTPYDERMRIVIAKAALAKARRDATFQVVPKALCKPVEAEARKVAIGDASTMSARRSAVMSWIGKLGIDTVRVFAAIGVKGEEDIGLDELTTLTGIKTAIKDGEVTVDEAFPLPNFSEENPTAESLAGKPRETKVATRPKQQKAESAPEPKTVDAPSAEVAPPAEEQIQGGLAQKLTKKLAEAGVPLKYFISTIVGNYPNVPPSVKLISDLSADVLDSIDENFDDLAAQAKVTQEKRESKA